MYNFNFEEGEQLIKVFDPIYIKQGDVEKNTAVAITTNRILFMGYMRDNPLDDMIPGKVIGVIKFKSVFYEIPLVNVEKVVDNDELYKAIMYNGTNFEFENEELFNLLVKRIKK